MKSSAQARISRSFQARCGLVPPMLREAAREALLSLQHSASVQLIFAPTEADSLVAEIATSTPRAYAVSQDSDYFILCARGQGVGYIPLDSIEFVNETLTESGASNEAVQTSADDGFEQVTHKRKGKIATSSQKQLSGSSAQFLTSLPPVPGAGMGESLKATRARVYDSHKLAEHLQVPPNLLPLLAAIVGNDYSSSLHTSILLPHAKGKHCITAAAVMLRQEWLRVVGENNKIRDGSRSTPPLRKGPSKLQMSVLGDDDAQSDLGSSATATPTRSTAGTLRPPSLAHDPVRVIVEAVVERAIAQNDSNYANPRYVATGEKIEIVDSIIENAATYSLLTQSTAPHLVSPSALFFGEALPALASLVQNDILHPEVIAKYRQAYESGRFGDSLILVMTQRIMFTHVLYEEVESPSIHTTAARAVRLWLYAVLFEAWGMSWARNQWEIDPPIENEDEEEHANQQSTFDQSYMEGESPDDLISVDTESSDSGVWEKDEDIDENQLPSRPGSVSEIRQTSKPAPGVTEYVPVGNKYTPQLVRIQKLPDLLKYGTNTTAVFSSAPFLSGPKELLPPTLAELLARHEASVEARASVEKVCPYPASDPSPPPVVLSPLNVRQDLFLHAHQACTDTIKALPQQYWRLACVLRALLVYEGVRLGVERMRYNWSFSELKVAIRSALSANSQKRDFSSKDATSHKEIIPTTRSIHLSAIYLTLLQMSCFLADALLLPVDVDGVGFDPYSFFDGPSFHAGMLQIHEHNEQEVSSVAANEAFEQEFGTIDEALVEQILAAIIEEKEHCLGLDALDLKRQRKAKKQEARLAKKQSKENDSNIDSQDKQSKSPSRPQNIFALLEQG